MQACLAKTTLFASADAVKLAVWYGKMLVTYAAELEVVCAHRAVSVDTHSA